MYDAFLLRSELNLWQKRKSVAYPNAFRSGPTDLEKLRILATRCGSITYNPDDSATFAFDAQFALNFKNSDFKS